MLTAITVAVLILVVTHLLVLLFNNIGKNSQVNHTIYLSGGTYAGDTHGPQHRHLIEEIDEIDETCAGYIQEYRSGKVTSSFSCIYVRLYQMCTGKNYDAYLESVLQIGRSSHDGECAKLVIEDPSVSKIHCVLYRRGEQILIQDMNSTNHTYVNEYRVDGAVQINHGDILTMGAARYQFQCYYQR